MIKISTLLIFAWLFIISEPVYNQSLPMSNQNFKWLYTSGASSLSEKGDFNHKQIFYIALSLKSDSFSLWIQDPGLEAETDLIDGEKDSQYELNIFGHENVYKSIENLAYSENHLIYSRIFSDTEPEWFATNSIAVNNGEYFPEIEKFIFRIEFEGIKGNDGNCYRFFLSTNNKQRKALSDSPFMFQELCIKLPEDPGEYNLFNILIPWNAAGISIANFDMDECGELTVQTSKRKRQKLAISENNTRRMALLNIFSIEKSGFMKINYNVDTIPQDNRDNYAYFSWLIEDKNGKDVSLPISNITNSKTTKKKGKR